MTYRPHGRHVSIDISNPEPLGICDKTQFIHLKKDLVKQMEWRGNALVWTGFLVGRDYVDEPNEQLRPPILPPDPPPLLDTRPYKANVITFNSGPNVVWNEIQFSLNSYTGSSDGVTTAPYAQILTSLQTGTIPNYLYGGGQQIAPYLPQAVLHQELEDYEWAE